MLSPSLYVLVVDHRDTLEVIGLVLEGFGCRFQLAPDTGSALRLALAAESFDLLLTGVQLGGRDGWTLIRALRVQGRLPPLVVSMSAGDDYTQAARSKAEGCNWHLVKPFHWAELQTILEAGARAQDEPEGQHQQTR